MGNAPLNKSEFAPRSSRKAKQQEATYSVLPLFGSAGEPALFALALLNSKTFL